jgi:hypothetical protein
MPANTHGRAASWMNVCNLEKKEIARLYLVVASVKFPIAILFSLRV